MRTTVGPENFESSYKRESVPQDILYDAKIPALSAAWHQKGETHSLVGGIADPDNSKEANEFTLFQAASLSKTVSAAIILDLAHQNKWDLDRPLAEMDVPFGSDDMRSDPRYKKLTTRMVLTQSSGLPNRFERGAETFIAEAEPGAYFTYSGIAYHCLKKVIEKILGKKWEELAQDFFIKVGMLHSTFQLPEKTHLKDSIVARGHLPEGSPAPIPSTDGFEENLSAGMLTTADDYVLFLQHCLKDQYLKNEMFASHTQFDPKDPKKPENMTWGCGMGILKENNKEIAFNWGDNFVSRAFCAIDIETGNAVACFVNSPNGPNVFNLLSERIVGNMHPIFKWLSESQNFKAIIESKPEKSFKIWEEMQLKTERDSVSAQALIWLRTQERPQPNKSDEFDKKPGPSIKGQDQ